MPRAPFLRERSKRWARHPGGCCQAVFGTLKGHGSARQHIEAFFKLASPSVAPSSSFSFLLRALIARAEQISVTKVCLCVFVLPASLYCHVVVVVVVVCGFRQVTSPALACRRRLFSCVRPHVFGSGRRRHCSSALAFVVPVCACSFQ